MRERKMNWLRLRKDELRWEILSFHSLISNRSKQELSNTNNDQNEEIVDINAPIGISYNPSIDIKQPEEKEEEKEEMKSSNKKKKRRRRKKRKNNSKKSSPWSI